MSRPNRVPLPDPRSLSLAEVELRAQEFASEMSYRRTVREFSPHPFPRSILDSCLRAAGSAPSGANQQPWHFVVVQDQAVKNRIRTAAEKEEKRFYEERASDEWLQALEPLGTDWKKPFLEEAPYLIAIFLEAYGLSESGDRIKHYYALESVGIATGFLIAALHHAGIATLTHTPSPMGFLGETLGRPEHERPFLLLVVGFAADGATVPDIQRKPLEAIRTVI